MSAENNMDTMEDDLRESNKRKAAIVGAYAGCVMGHKEARLFQDKVVPYWEDLCIIIGGDMADGGGAQSHADVENNHLNREEEVQETSMHEERIGVVGTEGDEEETTQDAKKSRSNARGSRDSSGSTTSKKRKKRKKTKYDLYAEKLSEITETIKGMSATKDEDVLSDVFDDVMKMKSMDSQKRIIDYDSLSSDIRKCKAFLAMNDQVKDDWVKLKFG
ncbi:hypothetical protein AMTR_s00074p00037630 [Amborella trichopoda]|uniref:Myb/SANT-like domain-containing protein n=1 Tax=Amborella trichopoda TaxID=13333 RepID=W1NMX2_AMBTC|nr:hypothetical protein AMTR_s00074p00037630 [Amborella trichopoda]